MVSYLYMQYMLQQHGDKHVVFLAMSVALLLQQYIRFLELTNTPREQVGLFFGGKAPTESSVESLRVIFATPVVYTAMLERRQCHIHHCSLLVFDEVHHARKKHPYAQIMREHVLRELPFYRPRIFGMTASPGEGPTLQATLASIDTLCELMTADLTVPTHPKSLGELKESTNLSETIIEIYEQSQSDVNVLKTISRFALDTLRLILQQDFSDMLPQGFASTELAQTLEQRIVELGGKGSPASVEVRVEYAAEQQKFSIRAGLLGDLRILFSLFETGEQTLKISDDVAPRLIGILHVLAERPVHFVIDSMISAVLRAWTTLEEVENFGADQTENSATALFAPLDIEGQRLEPSEEQSWRSWNRLKQDCAAQLEKTQLVPSGNGKVVALLKYLESMPQASRAIIFVQMRSTAVQLTRYLQAQLDPSVGVESVVGRSDMSSSNQIATVARFNEGAFRILVATSVAEEGLDIQACDLVIRMDGTCTAKSLIQSRGRARHKNSRYVLITLAEDKAALEFVMKKEEFMIAAVRHRCDPEGLKRDGIDIEKLFEDYTALSAESSSTPAAWIALHEFCQQSRQPLPEFAYTQNDMTPASRFTAFASIQGREFRATASTKNDAKFRVASALWAFITGSPESSPRSSHSPLRPASPASRSFGGLYGAVKNEFPSSSFPSSSHAPSSPFASSSAPTTYSSFGAVGQARLTPPAYQQPTLSSATSPPVQSFQNILHQRGGSIQLEPAPSSSSPHSANRGAVRRPRIDAKRLHTANSIGALQEVCQQANIPLPEYIELGQDPNMGGFIVECRFCDLIVHGSGTQKKMAKTAAAANMLQALYQNQ